MSSVFVVYTVIFAVDVAIVLASVVTAAVAVGVVFVVAVLNPQHSGGRLMLI